MPLVTDPAEVDECFETLHATLRERWRVIVDLRQHPRVAVQSLIRLVLENGYLAGKLFDHRRYAAVRRLNFTYGLIYGRTDQDFSCDGSYCYHDPGAAIDALETWSGEGDPQGWHRHTATGRRLAEREGEFDEDGRAVPVGAIYVRY